MNIRVGQRPKALVRLKYIVKRHDHVVASSVPVSALCFRKQCFLEHSLSQQWQHLALICQIKRGEALSSSQF